MNEQITERNLEEQILINRRLLNHLQKLQDSFSHIQSLSLQKSLSQNLLTLLEKTAINCVVSEN